MIRGEEDPTLCCAVRFGFSTLDSSGAASEVKTNKSTKKKVVLTGNSILSPLFTAATKLLLGFEIEKRLPISHRLFYPLDSGPEFIG